MKKIFLIAMSLVAVGAQAQYLWDDGANDGSIGLNSGGTITWGNRFTSVAGCELITSIDIAWGRNPAIGAGNMVPDGTPVLVQLWADPNANGSPDDAFLLQSVAGVTANLGDTFTTYDITDTLIAAGMNFFVGATITHAAGDFPASWDSSGPDGNSWIDIGAGWSGAPINLTQLAGNGLNGDWMVRANCEAVPEPATMAALGLGAVCLVRRRRVAKK